MFDQLEFQKFLQIGEPGKRIAIYKEFSADFLTPIGAVQAFHEEKGGLVLLESAEKDSIVGKYSLIGFDLCAEVRAYGCTCHIKTGDSEEVREGDPIDLLRGLKERYKYISAKPLPGFSGGTVGFLSYDAIRYFENIPDRHLRSSKVPDFFFQFFNGSIIFDNDKNKVIIVLVVVIDGDPSLIYKEAYDRIDQIYENINAGTTKKKKPKRLGGELREDLDDEAFQKIVEKAKEYIRAGDAFQIVVSRSFKKELAADPFDVYRALRMINPAPYMFYFLNKDFSILGASPEKLVSLPRGSLGNHSYCRNTPEGERY